MLLNPEPISVLLEIGLLVLVRFHAEALGEFRASIESSVSLVDRTSFAFMRREGITRAIAIDSDFQTAGFQTLPAASRRR